MFLKLCMNICYISHFFNLNRYEQQVTQNLKSLILLVSANLIQKYAERKKHIYIRGLCVILECLKSLAQNPFDISDIYFKSLDSYGNAKEPRVHAKTTSHNNQLMSRPWKSGKIICTASKTFSAGGEAPRTL